jgi:signal transduction histidine kinase/CheY-like chemotaxis protein
MRRVARTLADLPRVRFLLYVGLATVAALLGRLALFDWRPVAGLHGHGYCYLWETELVAAHVISDAVIGLSYLSISITLVYIVRHSRQALPYGWLLVAFGTFIVACGATHLMEIWTTWQPVFWLAADVKIITAIASVLTAAVLPPVVSRVLALVEQARVSDERRVALEAAHDDLDRRVRARTAELEASLERERRLRAEAEEANRAKEDFLATVSHELRTPLNAIVGWSELLQRPNVDSATLARATAAIGRSARAQAQVVGDLLDVSRIAAGKLTLNLQLTDLVTLAMAAVESVKPNADRKRQTLRVHLQQAAVFVTADEQRLQQVVWNLLANAIKFTPDGGVITVTVEQSGSVARLSVTDNGIGIAPEFVPRLFERFSQADSSTTRRFAGLGLGLAIVRDLIQLHGGAIEVESAGLGAGATFRVVLPVRSKPAGAGETDHRSAPPPGDSPLVGRALLVVDDDVEVLEIARTILEAAGASVVTAASADEGLAALAARTFDAIVCDIGMPRIDGHHFIGAARQRRLSRAPALALSGYARSEDAQRAVESGFEEHVAKPVASGAFVAAVTRLLSAAKTSSTGG